MRLAKLTDRPFRDGVLFTGALVLLGAIRVALTLLPFRIVRSLIDQVKTTSWLKAWLKMMLKAIPQERSVWAVKVASRLVPLASCLTQSLALEILLALQGIEARTHFGVAKSSDGRLEAHAWVESGGRLLIGATADDRYVPLTASQARAL